MRVAVATVRDAAKQRSTATKMRTGRRQRKPYNVTGLEESTHSNVKDSGEPSVTPKLSKTALTVAGQFTLSCGKIANVWMIVITVDAVAEAVSPTDAEDFSSELAT